MPKFHLLSEDSSMLELNDNGIAVVQVKGKNICVAKWNNEWYAFAAKCPHASGRMEEGFIDALGNIVCPVHRYRFSLTNGRNTSGEGYHLKTYKLEMRGTELYVEMETFNFF
jgi:nitrite reductase/ring-hydroxylating ferredoxin subunit